GLRHSSCEADEQSGAIRCGVGGAKGGDQGKCGPAKHAPDAESGKRGTSAGTHTESRKGKEEGEVHRALSPYQRRSTRMPTTAKPRDVALKDPKEWKIAGKPLKRLDTGPKVTGDHV